jgi:hypothetical protein
MPVSCLGQLLYPRALHRWTSCRVSVRKKTTVPVLLVLVLQELAELAERLGTFGAAVGEVGHALPTPPAVLEERDVAHVRAHRALATGEVVDLLSRVGLPFAAAAESALDVLNGVGARLEALVPADRARNRLGAMDLHVHVEVVLSLELSVTNPASEAVALVNVAGQFGLGPERLRAIRTLVRVRVTIATLDTLAASGAVALPPLVAAEF